MDAAQIIRRLGGIARTRELRAHGLTDRGIAAACKAGNIERVRIGTYADPRLPTEVKRAHRVGGLPACVTAASWHGLATLSDHPLHVEVGLHDSRFRDPMDASKRTRPGETSVVLHWERSGSGARVAVPLLAAVRQVVECLSVEEAICVVDSALNRFPESISLPEIAAGLSAVHRKTLKRASGTADSVPESVFRLRAGDCGIPVLPQAPLPGGLRGDFLIGERLVVEIDGEKHHAGTIPFRADRHRIAWLAARGYIVVQFTYDQVVNRWDEVLSVVTLVMSRGDHLWPRNRRALG